MKKVLVWETSHFVAGGQKMTLQICELMKEELEFCCLIPQEGPLSEELNRLGISYILMGDQTLPSGVKGLSAYFRYGWMSIRSIFRSLSAIRSYRPDVLYAPGPAALPWSAVCGALSGKPVVWHLHHIFLDGPTKKLLNICAGWKCVKKIIAVSGIVGEQITNPKGHDKMQVLLNPVECDCYTGGDASWVEAEMQQMLGSSERELLLTSIAVIRRAKRQDLFLEVVKALKECGVNAKGILVGEAVTDEDRQFRQELEAQLVQGGLGADVYFAGYRTNVKDYLAAVDMVMVPAIEGLSLVAMEAMSAGKDVVAPMSSGAEELMNAAQCGILYPPEATAEEIAQRIIGATRTDRSREIQNGQQFCLTLTPEHYKRKLQKLFSVE